MTSRPPPRSCFRTWSQVTHSHTCGHTAHPHFLPQEVESTSLKGRMCACAHADTRTHTRLTPKHTQLYPLTFQDPATIMACFQPSSSHIPQTLGVSTVTRCHPQHQTHP